MSAQVASESGAEKNRAAASPSDEEGAEPVSRDMQRLLIHESEVNPTRMVGKGSFGEVFLADYRGTTVAVKTLKVGGAQNVYNDERAGGARQPTSAWCADERLKGR